VRTFATRGYTTVCPNLFHRYAPGASSADAAKAAFEAALREQGKDFEFHTPADAGHASRSTARTTASTRHARAGASSGASSSATSRPAESGHADEPPVRRVTTGGNLARTRSTNGRPRHVFDRS
jgi:hypothetical protein